MSVDMCMHAMYVIKSGHHNLNCKIIVQHTQTNAHLSVGHATKRECYRSCMFSLLKLNLHRLKMPYRFKSRRGLNKHLRTHSLSKFPSVLSITNAKSLCNETFTLEYIGAKNAVCKICSNEFGSSAELNAHQQHGCEPLIEIDHIAMDCKPTVVVFANEFHGDDSKSIGNDLMNVDDEQPANAMNRKKNDTKGAAKRSNPQLECPECGKKYASKTSLNNHRHIMHLTENTKKDYSVEIDGKRRFKCPLCDMT